MVDETPLTNSIVKRIDEDDYEEDEEDPPIPQNYKFYNIDGNPT